MTVQRGEKENSLLRTSRYRCLLQGDCIDWSLVLGTSSLATICYSTVAGGGLVPGGGGVADNVPTVTTRWRRIVGGT